MALRREEQPDVREEEFFEADMAGHPSSSSEDGGSANKNGTENYNNTDDVRDAENSPKSGGWKNNVSNAADAAATIASVTPVGRGAKILAATKKSGPFAAIGGLIAAGVITAIMAFSGGVLPMWFQEVFNRDLDDLTTALDLRSDKILKSQMKKSTTGLCAGKISVKCKFRTMSKRQIAAYEKAGIRVTCDGGDCSNRSRNKVTAFEFDDSSAPGGARRLTDPNGIGAFFREYKLLRLQMQKGFYPKHIGMSSIGTKMAFSLHRLSKAKKLVGSTKDAIKERLNADVNKRTRKVGAYDGTKDEGKYRQLDDGTIVDEHGNPVPEDQLDEARKYLSDVNDTDPKQVDPKLREIGTKITNSGGFRAGASALNVLGYMDTACTIYQTVRAMSLIVKITQNHRLMLYASAFLTAASALRAGDDTEVVAEYLGDKLQEVDTRKTLGDISDTEGNSDTISNPNYGKAAVDSELWRLAQYGDLPNKQGMSPTMNNFIVGGNGAGFFDTIYQEAKRALGGNTEAIRDTCKIAQNNLVRVAGLAVGVLSLVVPGANGAKITQTIATIGLSLAAMAVTAHAERIIAEQAEDLDIDEIARYTDFAAAMFAGTSGIMGVTAQATGGMPVTSATIGPYQERRETGMAEEDALQTIAARQTPFDITNQYSFLGKTARGFASLTIGTRSHLSKIGSVVASLPTSLATNTGAISAVRNEYRPERFEICDDEAYKELDIKADVMCNIRHGWSEYELGLESDEVADYMVDNGYVNDDALSDGDADTGNESSDEATPLLDLVADGEGGDKFKKFLENCSFRITPWGEQGIENEDDWSTGKNCLGTGEDLTAEEVSHFKIFITDYTLLSSQDFDEPSFSETGANDGDIAETEDSSGSGGEGGGDGSGSGGGGGGVEGGNNAPAAQTTTEWARPWPSNYKDSGCQDYPRYCGGGAHQGEDLAAPGIAGGGNGGVADILAACTGVVTRIDNNGEFREQGNWRRSNQMVVNCGGGVITRYHHYYFRDVYPNIRVGVRVKAGTPLAKIGNQGNTGGVTGVHLHFEVRTGAKDNSVKPGNSSTDGNHTDPNKWLSARGINLRG